MQEKEAVGWTVRCLALVVFLLRHQRCPCSKIKFRDVFPHYNEKIGDIAVQRTKRRVHEREYGLERGAGRAKNHELGVAC